jgi:hypothetical protein
MIAAHFRNAGELVSPSRRPASRRDQKKGQKNVANRTTTRKPMLLLRLSGLFLLRYAQRALS